MCWIRYWNGIDLGDLEGALDLVHHLAAACAFTGSVMVIDGVRPGAAPDLVVVHGRVQRVQLQLGIAEPVAEFGDLRLVAIVQVLARAEDLHRGDSGLLDLASSSATVSR